MQEDVQEDPTQDPYRPGPRESEDFATLIEASRDTILMSYRKRLEEAGHPVIADTEATEHVMSMGAQAIADVAASVRAGQVTIEDTDMLTSSNLGEVQATRTRLTPVDSLSAAGEFFGVMTSWLASKVSGHPGRTPCFVVAMLAVNESSTLKVKGMTAAYTGSLLDRIHQAHLQERRRIARELHDRLGEGLSTALRQFELAEIAQAGGLRQPSPPSSLSSDVLVETMDRLRLVISDLRQDPVTNLEKALTQYLDAVKHDVAVRLRVNGDERWAAPIVIDESYLIIREAIRNVMAHARAQTLNVCVNLAPHELRASVEDDGGGFIVPRRGDPG
ncbi:MAG TPA: histidine kinase, partial [Streptosporangiaceae bacterium]|nr:histidine kinase [Streptosporangiaceae bacterium]